MESLNTLFIGRVFQQFDELPSTNQFALNLLSKSKPNEGTVISTLNQYAGKGQIGSKWESAPNKNIALSLILYPNFLLAKRQFLLNQAVSLGVLDFVAKNLKNRVKIKWPNDIYVGQNKIAGILIQNTLSGTLLQSSIIGIGININQTEFLSNPPNPTSFKIETGQNFELKELMKILFKYLEVRYLQLKSGKENGIHSDYLDNLYRFEEENFFQRPEGEIFKGKITGISNTGKLVIENKKGQELFAMKEVKFV